jgi:hypothetical protein
MHLHVLIIFIIRRRINGSCTIFHYNQVCLRVEEFLDMLERDCYDHKVIMLNLKLNNLVLHIQKLFGHFELFWKT